MKKVTEEKVKVEEIEKKIEEVIDKEMTKETAQEIRDRDEREARLEEWKPKTELGKLVRNKKITSIDEVFESGKKILEAEIVDSLLDLKSEMLNVGQAKGKFGGGKRRAWRQTQKKTKEGNIATFAVMAIVGDGKGHIGLGVGRAKETLPAREKAIRAAKLNIMKITRGCGSFDCSCEEEHSIPFKVSGKCSSVEVDLMPAPQGSGLVVGDELKKILRLAGIKDVYSRTWGQKRSTINFAKACLEALGKLGEKR